MKQALNLLKEKIESSSPPPDDKTLKKIIEGLLFATNEPLPLKKIEQIIEIQYPITKQKVYQLLLALQEQYEREDHAFQIDEIAEGFLLRTVEDLHPFIEALHLDKRGDKLSRAATEVLAIIVHKQPITRREIDEIRGVDSASSVANLVERNLIEAVGRKEVVGRPLQYGVTKSFLHYFGLKTLQDLTKNSS